ncbi:unnamed protein product, partial [Discosporangium mesarthrocarpum]
QYCAVDPTEGEEEVMKGRITFAVTVHSELCALHKNGGVAMAPGAVLGCAQLAAVKAKELHKVLEEALAAADRKALEERHACEGPLSEQTPAQPRCTVQRPTRC